MSQHTEIVVGFDGSPDATTALEWAVREAASRHLRIRVVHVEPDLAGWEATTATVAGAPVVLPQPGDDGAALVASAVASAERAGVGVDSVVMTGSVAAALVEQSRTADMVVIGSRGLGAVSSVVLGSTVAHVAAHAHCPVVAVRSSGDRLGPVVVGIDGSPGSEETVGWAIDHASRHGLALEVVHAYTVPVYPGVVPYVPPAEITRAATDFEERVAAEVMAGWQEKYPDVQVTMRLHHGRPAPALIQASERASLTVVGSRGRGAFLGMLLGSTSQSLLQHALGSVVVLRHHRH